MIARLRPRVLRLLGATSLLMAFFSPGIAEGQIRTDGSLGHPAQSLTGPNYVIPQTLGLLSGQNLFQSFSTFNLASGEAAYFTTSSSGIANIISRVTGGSPSLLYGNINVFAASGAPNFFFINPAGITFGNGATINVPAALHVTTANYLKFPDGRFYADTAHVSTFSSLAPEAFGFLGNTRSTITIADNAYLIQGDAPVNVVAGDVVVDDGAIGTFGTGDVRVAAVGMDAIEVPLTGALPVLHGNLQVTNGSNIFTDATSENGGNLFVSAGNITVDSQGSPYFTGIFADAPSTSSANAGLVQIQASGAVNLVNFGAITTTTESTGNVGSLTINAAGPITLANGGQIYGSTNASGSSGPLQILSGGAVTLSGGSTISSTTGGSGAAGLLSLQALGPLSLSTQAQIYSAAFGSGNSAGVRVSAANIALDGAGPKPYAGIDSNAAGPGSGSAGGVDVFSSGNITVANSAFISGTTQSPGNTGNVSVTANGNLVLTNGGNISANSFSSGTAGSISVTAENITLEGALDVSTVISAGSPKTYSGPAGTISVSTPGTLSIENGASISSSTGSPFNAGAITVNAGALYVNGATASMFATGIAADALESSGNAGSIDIVVPGKVTLLGAGQISSDSESLGNSGMVKVSAGSLTIAGAGAGISSNIVGSNAAGKSGNVIVDVKGPLVIDAGGEISADTGSSASAGSVAVSAASITLDGQDQLVGAYISSDSTAMTNGGNAGSVVVQSPGTIALTGNAEISSTAKSAGHAGSVSVSGANIVISGYLSGIEAEALSGVAQPGSVSVIATNSLSISDFAEISIASKATFASQTTPTLLSISAPNITLSEDALISALALGNAPASDILIKFTHDLILDPSAITTQSSSGNGGSITIQGGQLIELNHSQITTSVSGAAGNGGNIDISSTGLVLDSGFIQANTAAQNASGGKVEINVAALVPSGDTLFIGGNTPYLFLPGVSGFNVIQAAAPSGLSGTIAISNPALDLSGSLSVLAARLLGSTGLGHDRCHGSAGSSLAMGGRGGFAPSARELVRAEAPLPPVPPVASVKDGLLQLAALSGDCAR